MGHEIGSEASQQAIRLSSLAWGDSGAVGNAPPLKGPRNFGMANPKLAQPATVHLKQAALPVTGVFFDGGGLPRDL